MAMILTVSILIVIMVVLIAVMVRKYGSNGDSYSMLEDRNELEKEYKQWNVPANALLVVLSILFTGTIVIGVSNIFFISSLVCGLMGIILIVLWNMRAFKQQLFRQPMPVVLAGRLLIIQVLLMAIGYFASQWSVLIWVLAIALVIIGVLIFMPKLFQTKKGELQNDGP